MPNWIHHIWIQKYIVVVADCVPFETRNPFESTKSRSIA